MTNHLLYLAGTGSIIIVSILISVVAEKFEFWHKLDSMVKLAIQLFLSAGVSVVATFLVKNPAIWSGSEDYMMAVVNVIIAIATNQGWHSKAKELK